MKVSPKLELIVRNGRTYWIPVSEVGTINSFARWEQAFRIFSNIYTRYHPAKSSELIQYNHVIHTVSLSYVWDNIYAYDKEFRMHMAKHPEQSWAIILQQAWSMKLKDWLVKVDGFGANNNWHQNSNYSSGSNKPSSGGSPSNAGKSSEACRRYNQGRCKFGPNCHYDHKCSYCGKFGHMILT